MVVGAFGVGVFVGAPAPASAAVEEVALGSLAGRVTCSVAVEAMARGSPQRRSASCSWEGGQLACGRRLLRVGCRRLVDIDRHHFGRGRGVRRGLYPGDRAELADGTSGRGPPDQARSAPAQARPTGLDPGALRRPVEQGGPHADERGGGDHFRDSPSDGGKP
ncbi:MAG: hypothetical protein JWM17_2647 [Actinobacteria bacterium]|nr:hypothetical protein [Actinomycetota bacterium]